MNEEEQQILSKYLPENSLKLVLNLFENKKIRLVLVTGRNSKLGYYVPPYYKNRVHKISINKDQSVYAFLITLVHEFAHLNNFVENKKYILPHGKEWKIEYNRLMLPFLKQNIFPSNLKDALKIHLNSPKANYAADYVLNKAIKKYNKFTKHLVFLEDIPQDSIFILSHNSILKKGKKARSKFSCLNLQNDRIYIVSAVAEVILISKNYKENKHIRPEIKSILEKNLHNFILKQESEYINLHSVNEGELFKIDNRVFKKQKKIRSRYVCTEMKNEKQYIISGKIKIEKII